MLSANCVRREVGEDLSKSFGTDNADLEALMTLDRALQNASNFWNYFMFVLLRSEFLSHYIDDALKNFYGHKHI
jgi:hypothetical protein